MRGIKFRLDVSTHRAQEALRLLQGDVRRITAAGVRRARRRERNLRNLAAGGWR